MEYFTPKKVGEILHLSQNKVYRLFKLPGFPAVRIGRQFLVSEESLKKFLSTYEGECIILP